MEGLRTENKVQVSCLQSGNYEFLQEVEKITMKLNEQPPFLITPKSEDANPDDTPAFPDKVQQSEEEEPIS